MKIFNILFILIFPALLNADIIFKGNCGSYFYDLNIPHSRYYGAMCDGSKLLVYYDISVDRILSIYCNLNNSSCYTFDFTGRVFSSFNSTLNGSKVVYTGGSEIELLHGLAGLFIGFSFLYVFMRLV